MSSPPPTRRQIEALSESLARRGGGCALRWNDAQWSYAELTARAHAGARWLRDRGVDTGDRVACLAGARVEVIIWMLACYEIGAVWVPINTRYKGTEVEHILEDADARLLLVDEAGADTFATLPAATRRTVTCYDLDAFPIARTQDDAPPAPLLNDRNDEDLAMLIYTSGTTGKSKGVMLTYAAVLGNMRALTSAWQFSDHDELALTLPLFHVHGLCIGVHGALIHGVVIRLFSRFDADAVLEALATTSTVFMGVPTMYSRLVDGLSDRPERGTALARVRLFTSGSAALPVELFDRFEALTGHRILERYGMSETLITLTNPYDGPRRPGTVGHPVAGVSVEIRDEEGSAMTAGRGELYVKGDNLMRGYWRQPEATSSAIVDGWFATGDVVERDAAGSYRVVGRKSVDIIKSGGFKIAAGEIESVLRAHDDVVEAAVIGVPDPRWGERIVAFVELRDGEWSDRAHPTLEATLQAHCRVSLADYKCPRAVRVSPSLPRNALGKLQKHLLRAAYQARDAAAAEGGRSPRQGAS